MTDELKVLMYNGGWSGIGHEPFTYSTGTGQMNAAGVHCVTFLLLAKMCGVDVDEYTLQRSLMQFYRFAGHGNVPYGDELPEGGFRDNGKTGGLAVAMAVAARLTPDGQRSVYAKARDNSAMKSFYATNWFHVAHTGGGIGEIWHNVAMGLMHERMPVQYRSFMDERRWVMELSREWNGAIGIGGVHDQYDISASDNNSMTWGTYFALAYTLPRKTLQLSGAPKTEWCKTYRLPTRPWGNPADDIFLSMQPARHRSISSYDLKREVVPTDSSYPILRRIGDREVTDDTLLKYIHHPDFGLRSAAMRSIVRFGRKHLLLRILESGDPRVRHAGILAVTGMFEGRPLSDRNLRPEMFELIGNMIEDPDESLWVLQEAMYALKRAKPQVVAKHKRRLLEILKRDDWMLRKAAIEALSCIATDRLHYRDILAPAIKSLAEVTTEQGLDAGRVLAKRLWSAETRIKASAARHFEKAYTLVPQELVMPGGHTIDAGGESVRDAIRGMASRLPGGIDLGRKTPKMTMRAKTTGRDKDKYTYSGRFKSNRELIGKWRLAYPHLVSGADVERRVKEEAQRIANEMKKPTNKRRPPRTTILELKDRGTVVKSKTQFWSGDMLIDVARGEALKMEIKTIGGKKYLLVEKGGFGEKDTPEGWHCGYQVYER
jgi:hypothetical protein